MRGQKGITLVALIITIIVLLIIAVVAIGAVTESKIINHAQNAANTYNAEKDHEEKEIANAVGLIDNEVAKIPTSN